MNELNTEKIIKQYIENSIIGYESILTGNHKRGNKAADKIIDLYKYLEKNLIIAKEIYIQLLKHENVVARTHAGAHCLVLGIYIKEAEKTLDDIYNDKNNGIFSFNAKMTLDCWRNGELKIYTK